jgi:hypothetical protein
MNTKESRCEERSENSGFYGVSAARGQHVGGPFGRGLVAAQGDALDASEGSEGGRAEDGRVFNGCRVPRTRLRRWSGYGDC